MTNIIAIQNEAVDPRIVERFIDQIGHGAFAAARKTREPNDASCMTIQPLAVLARDARGVPDNVSLLFLHASFVSRRCRRTHTNSPGARVAGSSRREKTG